MPPHHYNHLKTPGDDEIISQQSWIIEGMDCPDCVHKLKTILEKEDKIQKVDVKFSSRKLQVVYTEDITVVEGKKIVSSVVSQLGLTLRSDGVNNAETTSFFNKKSVFFWSIFVVFIVVAISVWSVSNILSKFILSMTVFWGLHPVLKIAYFQARRGVWFGIETLMGIACIGALCLGDFSEAIIVIVLFHLGEHLEGIAAGRVRKEITAWVKLTPKETWKIKNGQRMRIQTNELRPGDIIQLSPGDRLPADGILLESVCLDQSVLTGESLPVEKHKGGLVSAGMLVINPAVSVKVTSEQGHNAVDRILHLIEEADSHKAPFERQIDRFSRRYTPLIIIVSLLAMLIPPLFFAGPWGVSVYRGLAILLIACPCALVISTPAAVTSAIASMAYRGGLIKGGAALENLAGIKKVAFDKTGTLTQGKLFVTAKYSIDKDDSWFMLAASVEQRSEHPLAKAVVAAAAKEKVTIVPATSAETIVGKGVLGVVSNHSVLLISPRFFEEFAIKKEPYDEAMQWIKEQENSGKTVVGACVNDKLCGLIAFGDSLREDAGACIEKLKNMGIESVMLTGDNDTVASHVAKELKIAYRAKLLPEDKVSALHELKKQSRIAMIGDGINDAPALKAADVGIAMGKGSDTALEVADAALTGERLMSLTEMITIARCTYKIIRQNIGCALGFKLIVLCTTLFGFTGLMVAILADVGATVVVTLNSLRLLRRRGID